MTIKRDPSRALQVGFLALLIISMAQAVYWIRDNVLHTHADEQRFATLYAEASAAELRELLPERVAAGASDAAARAAALSELERVSAARVNRYVWEGGFFLAVLLGGMLIMTRTISHDRELRRRQQNFLAAVSHEFKSPLASMQLASETLVMRSADADGKRLGARILGDAERLLRMVDNLLDTTRLEEGRHTLKPEPLTLRPVVDTAVGEVAERARSHGIHFEVEVPEMLALAVDRTAIESILRNLLDNAVKACVAGAGHSITVGAAHADGRVVLSVRDDGLGFPPEESELMFEKFYRLGDELRRKTPGTGLGLYLVRRLAEMSGAEAAASSPGPGLGAVFTVAWPESALR